MHICTLIKKLMQYMYCFNHTQMHINKVNKGPGPGLGVLILPVNSWFPRIHMMSAVLG